MFPADERNTTRPRPTRDWDLYLSSAEQLFKAGHPVGLPMGQTSDAVDWVGALFNSFGVVMVDDRTTSGSIRPNPPGPRISQEADGRESVRGLCLGRRGNNRWIISGKGSGIMNPPSSWRSPSATIRTIAEKIWHHSMPRGPKGRFVGQLPQFYGLWQFSKNKPAAKDLLLHLSRKESVAELVEASSGLRPAVLQEHVRPRHLEEGRAAVGTTFSYRRAATRSRRSRDGRRAPSRRPDLQPGDQHRHGGEVHASNEKLDSVIKWAASELEGTLRV